MLGICLQQVAIAISGGRIQISWVKVYIHRAYHGILALDHGLAIRMHMAASPCMTIKSSLLLLYI